MAVIRLTANADFGKTGQYIAKLTGRAPKVQFTREFVGIKEGKRRDVTRYETDECGLYEVNNETRKGKDRQYWLALPWGDDLCLLRTDHEDALAICKRLDSSEILTDFVKIERGDPLINRDGTPALDADGKPKHDLLYTILTARETKTASAAAAIETAVDGIVAILSGLSEAERKKALAGAKARLAPKAPEPVASSEEPQIA